MEPNVGLVTHLVSAGYGHTPTVGRQRRPQNDWLRATDLAELVPFSIPPNQALGLRADGKLGGNESIVV